MGNDFTCPACGARATSGVCPGPHPGYSLRNASGALASRYVELPDAWPVRDAAVDRDSTPDVHTGVSSSGAAWVIRYDPAARLRRQREVEAQAVELANETRRRQRDIETLVRLAKQYGYALRPLALNVPPVASLLAKEAQ
jgi:hypothetical protein